MMSDAMNAGLAKGLAYEDAESPYVLPKLQKSGSFIGSDYYDYGDVITLNNANESTNSKSPTAALGTV